MLFDPARRRTLGLLGGFALLNLPGCCQQTRPFPTSRITEDPDPKLIRSAFLRPKPTPHSHKPYKYCIDTHTHFFNASDVNVKGYLEGPVAHSIYSKGLRAFLIGMAPIIEELTWLAPEAAAEYEWVAAKATSMQLMSPQDQDESLNDAVQQHRDRIAEQLYSRMRVSKLQEMYMQLEHPQRGVQIQGVVPAKRQFTLESIRGALDPAARHARSLQMFGRQPPPAAESADSGGVIEFAGYMLSHRWMNLLTYKQFFTDDSGSFGIDAAFGSLVDFDYWLDNPPRSSRQDQVKIQSLLSLVSGGYMLPLVSYNPWTDIMRGGESLQLVKDAVLNRGFIGVKIYPPMGYFPYGNRSLEGTIETGKPRPNLDDLDNRLEALFSFCMDAKVPVMAHAGESMGRDDPSDGFGGPDGWRELLRQFRGKGAPIVDAAHFGGDSPKETENGDSGTVWPKQLAQLMVNEPNATELYGDLGYWTALRHCGELKDTDCKLSLQRITDALAVFPQLTGRIMYGTDWFMMSKEVGWQSYAEELAHGLSGTLPADRFFYWNAVQCFGLGANGENRERLNAWLSGVPGGLPAWLTNA